MVVDDFPVGQVGHICECLLEEAVGAEIAIDEEHERTIEQGQIQLSIAVFVYCRKLFSNHLYQYFHHSVRG